MAALNLIWFRAPILNYMYYVYVIRSQLDGRLYIGYTMNLRNRLQKHRDGEVISTSPRRPFELIFYEAYKSMEDAKRRERYFKSTKGKSSLRMMLQDSLKQFDKKLNTFVKNLGKNGEMPERPKGLAC